MSSSLNSLPKKILVMSACSGSGMMELTVEAIVKVINSSDIHGDKGLELNVLGLTDLEVFPSPKPQTVWVLLIAALRFAPCFMLHGSARS